MTSLFSSESGIYADWKDLPKSLLTDRFSLNIKKSFHLQRIFITHESSFDYFQRK